MATVFLLSPAYCAGRRAAIILRPGSQVPVATRLQAGTLTLGEAFSFLSGLYFRGKITYARAFAQGPEETLVITPTRGLQSPDRVISADLLREFASVDIDSGDVRYRAPLERDLEALATRLPAAGRVVLLGSVATGKYVDILVRWLGGQLHFPPAFIGRGDMSRGGCCCGRRPAGSSSITACSRRARPRRGPRPPSSIRETGDFVAETPD